MRFNELYISVAVVLTYTRYLTNYDKILANEQYY